jgi:hypothetical protein
MNKIDTINEKIKIGENYYNLQVLTRLAPTNLKEIRFLNFY